MGAFGRKQVAMAKVPSHIIELPLSAFADSYKDKRGHVDKPDGPAKVGFRLVAEERFNKARSEAAKEAWRLHPDEGDEPNRIDYFNEKLIGQIVAFATTEADDVTQPFFGEMPEDKVFRVLTSQGIRRLYDEFEAFAISVSPTAPEASDADLDVLADGLMSGELLTSMDIDTARRARRLLRHVLDLVG